MGAALGSLEFFSRNKWPTLLKCLRDFQRLDRGGSGLVDRDDLSGLMRSVGMPLNDAELCEMLDALDVSGKQSVSFEGTTLCAQIMTEKRIRLTSNKLPHAWTV